MERNPSPGGIGRTWDDLPHQSANQRDRPTIVSLESWIAQGPKLPGWLHAFWSLVNYGGEITPESIERLGPWSHLSRCVMTRRNPYTEAVVMEEPCILVHLDALPSGMPVEMPPEAWQYAFEEPWGHFKITPETSVKVVLESAETGVLVKGPISLLLLLAQDAIPLARLTPAGITRLAQSWEPFLAIHQWLQKQNRSPDDLDIGLSLSLQREVISELLHIITSPRPHILKQYVEEAWVLLVGKRSAIDIVSRTPFAAAISGDFLRWQLLHVRDPAIITLARLWRTSGQVQWEPRVGGTGTVDLSNLPILTTSNRPPSQNPFQVKFYHSFTPVTFFHTRVNVSNVSVNSPPRDLALSSLPIPTIPPPQEGDVLSQWVPGKVVRAFHDFYQERFGTSLTLREYHPGLLVFQEPVATPTWDRPLPRGTWVIVEVPSIPEIIERGGNNLAARVLYSTPVTPSGNLRCFIFSPEDACVEFQWSPKHTPVPRISHSARTHLLQATRFATIFRTEDRLHVDSCMKNLPSISALISDPDSPYHPIIDAWDYDSTTFIFEPFVPEEKWVVLKNFLLQIYPLAPNVPHTETPPSTPSTSLLPSLHNGLIPTNPSPVWFQDVLMWKQTMRYGLPGPSYLSANELRYLQQLLPVSPPEPPAQADQSQSSPLEVGPTFLPALEVFTTFQQTHLKRKVELVLTSDRVAEFRFVPASTEGESSPSDLQSTIQTPEPPSDELNAPPNRALVFVVPPLPSFRAQTPTTTSIPLPCLLRFLQDARQKYEVYVIHALDFVLEQSHPVALLTELFAHRPQVWDSLPQLPQYLSSAVTSFQDTSKSPEDSQNGRPPPETTLPDNIPPAIPPLFFGHDFSFISGLWHYDATLDHFDAIPIIEPPWDNYLTLFAHLEQSVYQSEIQLWDEGQRAWLPLADFLAGFEQREKSKEEQTKEEPEGEKEEEAPEGETGEEEPEEGEEGEEGETGDEEPEEGVEGEEGETGNEEPEEGEEGEEGETGNEEPEEGEEGEEGETGKEEPEEGEEKEQTESNTITPSLPDLILARVQRLHPETKVRIPFEETYLLNVDSVHSPLGLSQDVLEDALNPENKRYICFISGKSRRILKTTLNFLIFLITGKHYDTQKRQELSTLLGNIKHTSQNYRLNFSVSIDLDLEKIKTILSQEGELQNIGSIFTEERMEDWDFGIVWHLSSVNPRYLEIQNASSTGVRVIQTFPLQGFSTLPTNHIKILRIQRLPVIPQENLLDIFEGFLAQVSPNYEKARFKIVTPAPPKLQYTTKTSSQSLPELEGVAYEFEIGGEEGEAIVMIDVRRWKDGYYDRFAFNSFSINRILNPNTSTAQRIFLVNRDPRTLDNLLIFEVKREFVWVFYGYFEPEIGRNKLERDLTKADFKRLTEEIPEVIGRLNIYFPYIEEIVNAISDSQSTRPQLSFSFIPFIEDALVAGWIFNKKTSSYEQIY
ncbi:MAG: hypothetical protein RBG13Loki_3829 [Promethearchaeota archaeon CR_4]|nr:MAG: hypothetical protein RBG13Loki_3829 [Candidatus Lokiarchaeota archaeon CR_4]